MTTVAPPRRGQQPARPTLTGIVGLLIILVGVIGSMAWKAEQRIFGDSSMPLLQTAQVPMPPVDATPRQVLVAYLAAVNAHDAATALALTAPSDRSGTTFWLDHATSLRPMRIGTALPEGRGAEISATVDMQLNITPESQGFNGNGELVWFWSMAPDKHTGRLLITSEGSGP